MVRGTLMVGLVVVLIGLGVFLVSDTPLDAPTMTPPSTPSTSLDLEGAFVLTSSAFGEGESIPSRYTCDGDSHSPPLTIHNPPSETVSFALIMEDPDIPEEAKARLGRDVFDHWVLFNIPGDTREIPEDSKEIGREGKNSTGSLGYRGPCPPSGTHRYITTLYALREPLLLAEGSSSDDVREALEGKVLSTTVFTGMYSHKE